MYRPIGYGRETSWRNRNQENTYNNALSCWSAYSFMSQNWFYRATLCIARSLLSCGVRLSVRPSVSLSVTLVYCVETAKLTTRVFHRLVGGPIILVFPQETWLWNSDGVTPSRAPKSGGGTKNLRFSTNISLCHGNDARYGHSYYGTLIGNHRRSIEPCHSRWPWVRFEGHFGDSRSISLERMKLCALT